MIDDKPLSAASYGQRDAVPEFISDVASGAASRATGAVTAATAMSRKWEIQSLRSCLLAAPDYGINAPAVAYSDRLPTYLRITDITEEGRLSKEGRVSVHRADADIYYLQDGDIVLARTGASVGKSYRYRPEDGIFVFAGFLIRLRPDPNKLLPSYLAAYLQTDAYWNWVRLMSMRSGQPGINGREYGQLPMPVPPMPEQRVIANALDDTDAVLEALDRLIAKKRDLKQAAMQQLLTGQTRLRGFRGRWDEVSLGELFSFKNGLNKGKEYFGSGTPIVNYMDVFRGGALRSGGLGGRVSLTNEELKNFEVRKGDVGVSRIFRTGC